MATINPANDPGYKYSVARFTGDGGKTDWDFNFAGGYVRREHIKAYTVINDVYNPLAYTWVGDNTVRITPAVANGVSLIIRRETPKDIPMVDFTDGAIINERNLDTNAKQAVFTAAEMVDAFGTVGADAASAALNAQLAASLAGSAVEAAEAAQLSAADVVDRVVEIEAEVDRVISIAEDIAGEDFSDLARLDTAQVFEAPQEFPAISVGTREFSDAVGKRLNEWADLFNKPTLFPPQGHGHLVSDVSGLSLALASKAEALYSIVAGFSVSQEDKNRERVSVRDFGAVGDNITDDTAAVLAAVAYCNSLTTPVELFFPSGIFEVRAPIRITGGTVFKGSGTRSSAIRFTGDFDCLTYEPVGNVWSGGAGCRDMLIHCEGMTGGTTFVLDNTRDFKVINVLCAGPYNFANARQASDITFSGVDAQPVRGDYGIRWWGTGSNRKGRIDKSDVMVLENVTLHGLNVAGSGSTAIGIELMGYVHTLSIKNVRVLALKRGMSSSDPYGLPNTRPSFILGSGFEVENSFEEHMTLANTDGVWLHGLWLVGSTSLEGVFMSDCTDVVLSSGRCGGNWTSGMMFADCSNVKLVGIQFKDNSQYEPLAFDAVTARFCDNITLLGCSTIGDRHRAILFDDLDGSTGIVSGCAYANTSLGTQGPRLVVSGCIAPEDDKGRPAIAGVSQPSISVSLAAPTYPKVGDLWAW